MEISRCGAIGMREALRARRFGRKMMQIKYRDVAQLVARLVWDQDVAGSNPVIPTKHPQTGLLRLRMFLIAYA